MIKNKRKVIISIVSVAAVFLFSIIPVSCMGIGPFTGSSEDMTAQGMEIFEVQRGDILQLISTTGSVDSNVQNTYTLQGSGEIVAVLEKGDEFKKGDTLVELDNSDGLLRITEAEKDIELSEISLKTAKLNYQKALDENHIAVQISEINTKKAEESTESALKSLECANSNASLAYKSALRALENAEEQLQIAKNDPTTNDMQMEQYESNVESAEAQVGSTKESNKSSTSQSESSYNQSLLSQSSTYWNNLSSAQNAELQIENTRNNIRQAEIQLELAKMNLESAKEDITTNYMVSAPYDGIILSSDFKVGNQNSGSNSISVIADDFSVKTTVGETDIAKILEGDEAYIALDAYPDTEFIGQIEKIIPISVEEGNIVSFEVVVSFNNDEGIEFFYGLSTNVDIVTEKADNVLLVPIQSVYKENGKSYVDLLISEQRPREETGEYVKKVEVTTGINDYYYMKIISGLKEGDKIITSRI
jgi:multidrug efflux pump subunit AcrA (membrane-fusion protein)